ADAGTLHDPAVLRRQTERLLDDPKAQRFVNAFLDYWLDLRLLAGADADAGLYPDYYLDDLLIQSMTGATQQYFRELLRRNLGVKHLVASDFAMLNERLADHYGIPGVGGVNLRPVPLPTDSVRGGLLTQASVLKVTANGTTTTPVKRGAWVMARLLGKPPPPPPAAVPAIEPDTRGATTIREQLARHRQVATCAACHAKIDPPGFALENFDVIGGWRGNYRSSGNRQPGGLHGPRMPYLKGPKVDAGDVMPDGQRFRDIDEFKQLLLKDKDQVARALTVKLLTYATGGAPQTADRPEVEAILEKVREKNY